MVTSFYNDTFNMVDDLLERYGDPIGTLVLIRTTAGVIDPTNPSAGPTVTTTEYQFSGYLFDAEIRDEDGITRSETKINISPDSIEVIPKDTDKIKVLLSDGTYETYNIMRVKRTRLNGKTVLYTLTLED